MKKEKLQKNSTDELSCRAAVEVDIENGLEDMGWEGEAEAK